ncbi:hypothetical protein P154DRAFT_581374 [Amniculicola lignicola CBS 123094]|uniref:Gamma-glutamylcyclotransferase AIG2-like domain-containing protein n=1 Tax=Amniculicola lignicola CBS 123094 TaxID=1392246 RepID=A0A6A5VZ19_9PLEO|nr:hypothetical protein P154DRAFT_581374 [Amniculicola lignicola CBS 123094]
MALYVLLILRITLISHLHHNPHMASPTEPTPDTTKKKIHSEDLRLYSLALNNRWTRRELFRHIVPDVPVFVYCPLILPWVLAKVIHLADSAKTGAEQTAKYMTRAALRGYFRTMMKYVGRPTIVRTRKEAAVDGMLITGLLEDGRKKIEMYIGLNDHRRDVVEVEVEATDAEKIIVAAYTYVWKGPMNMLEPKHWTPMDYMRSALGP